MPGVHGAGCGCKDEKELLGGECLRSFIKIDDVICFNEQVEGSAKKILKSYTERLDDQYSLKSAEGDPELLLHIPFTSPCKVASMHLIGGENGTYPTKVRIFSNREDLDFTTVNDAEPIQEVSLTRDFHGAVEYPLKVTKLLNVSTLTLHFPENEGANYTEIFYIGLRGQGSTLQRKAVVTVYEAQRGFAETDPTTEMNPAQLGF